MVGSLLVLVLLLVLGVVGGGDGGEGVGVGFAAVVEKIARLWAQVGRACTLR